MDGLDLEQKFPDMRPLRSAPGLGTINGIGLAMCGARDRDDQTSTYVKTRCFTVLFIRPPVNASLPRRGRRGQSARRRRLAMSSKTRRLQRFRRIDLVGDAHFTCPHTALSQRERSLRMKLFPGRSLADNSSGFGYNASRRVKANVNFSINFTESRSWRCFPTPAGRPGLLPERRNPLP